MVKLAIFGHPVAHSLSPQIHQQFAAQFNLTISYEKILVPLGDFPKMALDFFAQDGLGCNVTVPFKVEAFHLVHELSTRAKQASAVNVIKSQGGKLFGDNTDGIGFLNDLQAKKILLKNKRIVLVGAGGAARGLLPVLLEAAPAELVMMNRDVAKAAVIARSVSDEAIQVLGLSELPKVLSENTLLIDATSNFDLIKEILTTEMLPNDLIIYDLKYGREAPTPLIQWANQRGLVAYDGLGMLIEQAAEAFNVWFGLKPEVDKVKVRAA